MDWFSTPTNYVEQASGDGFNFGALPMMQYFNGPTPDGATGTLQRANTEHSWFDQSKIVAGFGDILNAGLGGLKTAIGTEISGGSANRGGLSFFDTLTRGALDRFTSSKTGQQIRSEVLMSQFRTAMTNPLVLIGLTAGIIGLVLYMRR